MRFLLDANMPRSAAESIRRMGHEALDVRDIGLGGANDKQIAAHAREYCLTLITRDFDFSDVRNYPPTEFADTVLKAVESFLCQPHLLSQLAGHLAIVELWRVRFRPTLS